MLRDVSAHQSAAEELIDFPTERSGELRGEQPDTDHSHTDISARIAAGRHLRGPPFLLRPGPTVCRGEMAGILAWFWNERFWLPHNVTWADLKNTDEATFPQAEDLYLACPVAFCIFMIRLVFERWVPQQTPTTAATLIFIFIQVAVQGGLGCVDGNAARSCVISQTVVTQTMASSPVSPQITGADRPSLCRPAAQSDASVSAAT